MLNFVESRVAINYLVLVLISFTGVLQISAARFQLRSLSLISSRQQPWLGTLLGLGMIIGAYTWFVAATPDMLRPGPAGFEISLLFAIGTLLAALACRLVAILLHR